MAFLKINVSVWAILAVSVVLALAYAWLRQRKTGKGSSAAWGRAVFTCIGIALAATVISKYQT